MSGITGLIVLAAILLALLIGVAWGAAMQADAARRAAAKARRRMGAEPEADPAPTSEKKPTRKRMTASKLIALGVLFVDASCTYIVLYLCWLSIKLQFSGGLPYLTTLIGALQAATGYVLGHYFKKSTAENTKGGITYDTAVSNDL